MMEYVPFYCMVIDCWGYRYKWSPGWEFPESFGGWSNDDGFYG
jgi:hypothetical protein